jgi:flagellar hook protein FlgE
VIGHNIANANTTGFKASRAEFADMVASAIGGAGGSNVGIGVQVAAVAQQFTQGNLTVTGNTLDVAINGSGFFMLQQPDGSSAYTRAGNFKLDKDGDLKTNSGANVLGYPIDPATGKHSHRTGHAELPRPSRLRPSRPPRSRPLSTWTRATTPLACLPPGPPPTPAIPPTPVPPMAPRSMCSTARAWPSP